MITVKDISYILAFEKAKLRSSFQQQLTSSLSHEKLTPLNSILNLSEIVLEQLMYV